MRPRAASASTWSKNPAAVPNSTLGIPSRSARRRARSSISRVGPPPPSPYPNGSSDQLLHACSAKFDVARASSAGVTSALYVSTGGKWVSTRVPSMPSQKNVECGNRLVRFHDSFWVTNRRIPPAANTWGRPAGYPNTSGIHTSRQRIPKCASKKR